MKKLSFVKTVLPKQRALSVAPAYMINPLIGFDVGIPLNINQNIFTNLHYGVDVVGFKLIMLQFLIGYYAYGRDRFKDALEYESHSVFVSDTKQDLYKQLLRYKKAYIISYYATYAVIAAILVNQEKTSIPFLFALATSEYYNEIKRTTPFAKPLYVSVMWTLSSVILPCVLYEHSYAILNHPGDYLPCLFTLFAVSSFADIKDTNEDRANGVKTLPVCYGIERTQSIIFVALALSSLLFGLNEHYLDRPVVNALFELQNAGIAVLTAV
jgi:hypothetical protein